jgi:outer membrane receptor protein involved in Fe transport
MMVTGAQAQEVTGSISGTITDPSGAVIKGATVILTDVDRNVVVRKLTSNDAGFYTAQSLPLGGYKVSISDPGFGGQTVSGIVLHANDTLTINGSLKPGADENVTVSAEQTAINLETAAQSTVIEGTQVRELALSTRNYEQLVGLQPGVAYSGGDQIYIGNSNPVGTTNVVNFSVNGARTSGNSWTVDGADNVDRGSNFTLLTYPSVDAIAEFKTLRGTYSAEYGRSASGQVNVITKSGTTDFHGTAYEFIRNDLFNANSVLNKQPTTPSGATKPTSARSKLRYNDFGYTFGGPVWIPHIYNGRERKTFFFFSQELRRVVLYNPITLSGVPTLVERTGTFTSPVCSSQNTYLPGDPATTSANLGKCKTTGSTKIPITSPMAQAYLKDIFANVGEPDPTGTLVLAPQRSIYNGNQQIVRIDQSFGTKMTAFFRWINDSIPTIEPGGLFQGNGYPGVNTTSTNAPGRIWLGHMTYVISPTFLVEGGYAYSHGALLSDPIGLTLNANSPDIKPTLPYVSTLARVPALTFNGAPTVTTYGPYRDYNRNHNVFGTVTKTLHTHTLRVGMDYNHYNKQENNAGANAGSFAFNNGNLPGGSGAQPWQQSWANFLSGYVTTFTQASVDVTPSVVANQFEVFVQDNWKVTPRLTLNLGVRYSYFAQPTDSNGQLTTFDPSLYSAANAPTVDTNGLICVVGAPCTGVKANGTVTYAQAITNGISVNGKRVGTQANGTTVLGVNSPYGNKVGLTDKLNFAPRVGFALDLFGNGRTSLRGGYGLAYDSALFGTYEQNIFQNPPFVVTPTISNTSFDNPAAVSANVSYSTQVIRATSPQFHTPYDQQYSLSIQHEAPLHIFTEVAYVGSTQVHLLGLVDINQPAVGAFAAANRTILTSSNIALINPYRPYKGFSAINSVNPIFSGNYNSLQVSLMRHFAHSSQIGANYTFSKALTNANADRTGAPQISTNPGAEYGRAAADRRNMFNMNAIYALPFFYEQHGVVGRLLGGWEVSGLAFVNSGLPLNATTTGLDPAGVGVVFGQSVASGRPDRVGDPNADNPGYKIHTRQHWFNVGAFSAVPAGQIRGGNAQRNVIEGPGWWRADLGLFKNVTLYERLHLQLRGEAYNVFNHTNPDTVTSGSIVNGLDPKTGATTYSTTAGNITGYRDKRILQLGAKIVF